MCRNGAWATPAPCSRTMPAAGRAGRASACRGARRFLFVAPRHAWPAVERREAGFAAALPPDARASSGSPATRPTMPASWRPSRRGWLRPLGPTPWPGPMTRSACRGVGRRPINAGLEGLPTALRVTGFNGFTFRPLRAAQLLTTVVLAGLHSFGRAGGGPGPGPRLDGQPFPSRAGGARGGTRSRREQLAQARPVVVPMPLRNPAGASMPAAANASISHRQASRSAAPAVLSMAIAR